MITEISAAQVSSLEMKRQRARDAFRLVDEINKEARALLQVDEASLAVDFDYVAEYLTGDISLDDLLDSLEIKADSLAAVQVIDQVRGRPRALNRIQYRCRGCTAVFLDAATSNEHHDETGHHQTFRCPKCTKPLSGHTDAEYLQCFPEARA